MTWSDKKVMVMGMAKSGVSAAKLLIRNGADILINDSKGLENLTNDVSDLVDLGAQNILGLDPTLHLQGVDTIVISPGIPLTNPIFAAASDLNIPIIAEIELGYLASKAPIIAIGGTNGKTTTTALTGVIFEYDSKEVEVLGNIGEPLCEKCESVGESGYIVAEIASLQLETTADFRPKSAVLLNITEDHLDRFKTMEYYTEVKTMMFNNQNKCDFAVINADDAICVELVKPKINARLIEFSASKEVENGSFIRDDKIIFRLDEKESEIIDINNIKIKGRHNLENALAAVAVSMPLGISAGACKKALETFPGVEHRIESFANIDGVEYINDSKATNPVSTIKAVEAMTKPTILLLGGSNKNSDYMPIFDAFGERVKAVVAYGETKNQILRDAKKADFKNIHVIDNVDDDEIGDIKDFEDNNFARAVDKARSLANYGDVVLLSPACASYDEFDNFEERGDFFKKIIAQDFVKLE